MQDPVIINQFAEALSRGTASLKIAWKVALESLPALSTAEVETVALATPSPDCLRQFGQYLGREADPAGALSKFLQEVDESDEELKEWMKAFEVLACFLESTAHRPGLGSATGYLHCCQAVSHTGARYASFPMTVETMLETYGYAGESE